MVVSAIAATSISLSWSVASGSVARSEVVWRETDRGTESSSGSLTGTSYTIDQLESTTIYTVTVRASNVAGTTDSQPLVVSTGIYTIEIPLLCHMTMFSNKETPVSVLAAFFCQSSVDLECSYSVL